MTTLKNKSTTKRKASRTCISCGAVDSKGSFLRIVRDGESKASFDATGRKAGRGAYVCDASCFASARKTDKLSRALRCKVTGEDYERIAREIESYATQNPVG